MARKSLSTRISSTTAKALGEIAVATLDPRALVGVDLSRGGEPADTLDRVVVEQQCAFERHPTGYLQGGRVEDQQVDTRRPQDVKGLRRLRRPPGCNVQVGVGTSAASSRAAEDQGESAPSRRSIAVTAANRGSASGGAMRSS